MMLELSDRLFSDFVSFLLVRCTHKYLQTSVFYFHLCRTEFILSSFTVG